MNFCFFCSKFNFEYINSWKVRVFDLKFGEIHHRTIKKIFEINNKNNKNLSILTLNNQLLFKYPLQYSCIMEKQDETVTAKLILQTSHKKSKQF